MSERSPAVAARVGLVKHFSMRLSLERLPLTRSPNLCIRTPPPNMFDSFAIDSPYSLLSLNGSVKLFDTSSAKLVFSVCRLSLV